MRVLVAGWFSFSGMNCTAGDVLARDLLCDWLDSAGVPFDVATLSQYGNGIEFSAADPGAYSHLVFVCGPFRKTEFIESMLRPFTHSRIVGLNLSMLTDLALWNPFHYLFERDSTRTARPDITFGARTQAVEVAGIILVHDQPQYGKRSLHKHAGSMIDSLCRRNTFATVHIDTCLDNNTGGLRTAREVESVIARMDFVITTRLHGTVLALKNGVPALAIDPIAGGAKITSQSKVIGWHAVLQADALTDSNLDEALSYCRSAQARSDALACAARAGDIVGRLQTEFLSCLSEPIAASERPWRASS